MLKHHFWLTAALGLALTVNLVSPASAEDFQRTIRLGPNVTGNFVIEDLGIGDRVTLTLVNPTNAPLTFQTTQLMGQEKSWVVPANTQQTVSFIYNTPFSDSVNFVVLDTTGNTVSQGVLFAMGDEIEENVFRRTVSLIPGENRITIEDLGAGDNLVLTLQNPSSIPLAFQTTEGANRQMVIVPPNSSRTISYEYDLVFSDDVRYLVTDASTMGTMGTMGATPSTAVGTPQPVWTTQESVVGTTGLSPQTQQTVRGFW